MKPLTQIACHIHQAKWYRCQCDSVTLRFP